VSRARFCRMSFAASVLESDRARTTLVTLLLFSTASLPNVAVAQCTEGWKAPRVLEAVDGRPAYVEAPVAVPTKGGLLLLGVPAWLWAERDAFDPFPSKSAPDTAAYVARLRKNIGFIGFVLGRERTATPVRPPSARSMRRLLAVPGADGAIHVAWFAPPPGSTDPDAEGSVWYAERHGDQWTVPTMVFSADHLDWSGLKAALLIRNTSDVHILVPYSRAQDSGIAYIRRTGGRWTTTVTPLRGLPSRATAQFIGNDSLAVAFAGIGAPGVRVRNGQHVFLIRAAISDTGWPTPALINYSGLDGVRWLGMYGASSTNRVSRQLTLVWNRTSQASRSSADTVYAMISEDAGVTWHSPQMLPLPFKVSTLSQARDAKGNVHLVLTSSSGVLGAPAAQMYHASLSDGHWSGLDSVSAGSVDSAPTISSIGPDTLLVAWGNARPADRSKSGVIAPVSKYATFVSACPRVIR
jgi:hypothetical protein